MKNLRVEIIGTDPPCVRCNLVKKNVEKVASKLRESGVGVAITKLNITSKDTVKKYGIILTPAIAVNDVIKVMGKVPDVHFIEKLLINVL